MKKQELDRSARTKGRPGKLSGAEEALRSEDGRAGTEECSVGCDPDRLETTAEFERMRSVNIGEVFLGFKLRFFVIGNAAGKPAADQRVRDIERRFIACPFGVR